MFPTDSYTPYGYLDTPGHTRNLTPRGVLRSHAAGFRWHVPAYGGMYGGTRETYRAGLRLALNGVAALDQFDRLACPYHSKDLFSFVLAAGDLRASASFQQVNDHALGCALTLSGSGSTTALLEYTRLLSANGQWGESGLIGRLEDGLLVLQAFEDGEALVLWSSVPWTALRLGPNEQELEPLPAAGFLTLTGRRGEPLALHAALTLGAAHEQRLILARGRTVAEARHQLNAARIAAPGEQRRKQAADAAFWSCAPQLGVGWPDHWRRGLVYDLETVRMMVRQPIGVYSQVWDAMQIQAPRVVLAEAAIDALLLGYADPQRAQALLLATFLDALAPNVPCSREDGSVNMVAADGTLCGTAPSWGYPFLVAQWLHALRPDLAWLAAIYRQLSEHLDWWLTERRAADGWPVYACSWESGQDDSPRFGAQPLGGGHPIRHIRPADLTAALLHAAETLAGFALELSRLEEQQRWLTVAAGLAAQLAQLWDGARYADFDTQAGALTAVDDVMLLAPLALLGTDAPHAAAALAAARAVQPDWLTWPMLAWTATEALLRLGDHARAAELAAAVVERAYGFWDARTADPQRTLPGIACEYWPLDGRCGGEGYGWGALTSHLLLHVLFGYTPGPDGLTLRPNLPLAWRVPGHSYGAQLPWRGALLSVTLTLLPDALVRVTAGAQTATLPWGAAMLIQADPAAP